MIGAIFGFLSVAIGAFAAHGLKLEGYAQSVFETGVRYQFYHALALMVIGFGKQTWFDNKVGLFWTVGIFIFSGSLYGIVLLDEKRLGMITPLGGICFLVGWMMLILRIYKSKDKLVS